MIKLINANGGVSSSRSIYLNETAETREELFICSKLDAGIFFPLISDCQVHLHLALLGSLKDEDIKGRLGFVFKDHKRPGTILWQQPTTGADVMVVKSPGKPRSMFCPSAAPSPQQELLYTCFRNMTDAAPAVASQRRA